VLTAIKGIQDIKQDRGVKYPALHLVFLMLKDNIEELPRLPALAKQFRIDQIILLNIIQVSNGTQADQRVFMRTEESFEPLLVRAEKNAARLGIHLTRPALSPSDVAVCTENPLKNLYISVEGDVSPCVYLYPPVPSPFTTIFCSDRGLSEKVSFGNIFAVPFGTIWEGGEYRTFRNRFEARKRAARPSLVSLLDHGETRSSRHLPAPPAQCLRCHKILGF
jgi:MoaA/NifB/PqqE/SkfB family radical SAM enzyme